MGDTRASCGADLVGGRPPVLDQDLRSTVESRLMEAGLSRKFVSKWQSHTANLGNDHYLSVTDRLASVAVDVVDRFAFPRDHDQASGQRPRVTDQDLPDWRRGWDSHIRVTPRCGSWRPHLMRPRAARPVLHSVALSCRQGMIKSMIKKSCTGETLDRSPVLQDYARRF